MTIAIEAWDALSKELAQQQTAETKGKADKPADKPGQNCPSLGKGGRGKTARAPGSTRDLAAKTGRSEGAIKALKKRAKALPIADRKELIGTALDKGVELDALTKLLKPKTSASSRAETMPRPDTAHASGRS